MAGYVQREVMPFVPDAWVDEGYTDARDGQVGHGVKLTSIVISISTRRHAPWRN